jgi:hypothetical protein
MKPNTSALGMGGCSSWLLAKAEYREWYTDAVEKAFCHNEKMSKIAGQLRQRETKIGGIRKSRNARQSRQRCDAQNRKRKLAVLAL